jgi:hypothetical protein
MSSNFRTTLNVFIWKIYKEKHYYWKKNLFYTLLPIVLLLLPLALLNRLDIDSTQEKDDVFEPDTTVSTVIFNQKKWGDLLKKILLNRNNYLKSIYQMKSSTIHQIMTWPS